MPAEAPPAEAAGAPPAEGDVAGGDVIDGKAFAESLRARVGAAVPAFVAAAGRKPFSGATPVALAHAIRQGQAEPLDRFRPDVDPDLAARILGPVPAHARCENSNLCVPAQMLGMKGVCYNPAVTGRGRGTGGPHSE